MRELTAAVSTFLNNHIPTVGHLEILIFIYEGRDRAWSKLELSKNMRTNESMVERHLYDLRDCIIEVNGQYQFKEDCSELETLALISELYRSHKHAIISEIYSRSLDTIRSFSDAFKIKKEDK